MGRYHTPGQLQLYVYITLLLPQLWTKYYAPFSISLVSVSSATWSRRLAVAVLDSLLKGQEGFSAWILKVGVS
jgi:hypothetical protein